MKWFEIFLKILILQASAAYGIQLESSTIIPVDQTACDYTYESGSPRNLNILTSENAKTLHSKLEIVASERQLNADANGRRSSVSRLNDKRPSVTFSAAGELYKNIAAGEQYKTFQK